MFLHIIAMVLFLGAGCSNNPGATPAANVAPVKYADYVAPEVDRRLNTEGNLKNLENNFLRNRFVPSSTLIYGNSFSNGNLFSDYNLSGSSGRDCISVNSAYATGGDLLSSLAGDDGLRGAVDLKNYSPRYVLNLKKQINLYTEREYGRNLFAFHVCNLDSGLDLVAGYLWSGTSSPYFINSDMIKVKDEFFNEPILVLVNKGAVIEIKDVQSFGANGTGGETGPCDAKLSADNTIAWDCFGGLGDEAVSNSTYGKVNHWQIGLDGEILNNWETRD